MSVKATVQKLISFYLCRFKNVQDFFVIRASEIEDIDNGSGREFFDIDNIDDFNKICKRFNFTVSDADAKQRFDNKCHFCVITQDNHFGCWGWYTTSADDFYVLEIDRKSPVPENTAILFHYYTNENYRRQGYYSQLLKNVVKSSGKEYSIIYAYDTNPASSGAIRKVGFHYAGRLGHNNFRGFQEMINNCKTEDEG